MANILLFDLEGDRVHCGTLVYIRYKKQWMWARYEMDSAGDGYWVIDNERCIGLNDADAIDWSLRPR